MNALIQIIEIVRKELKHVLRDRRTVASTQLYAMLGPVLLVATISAMTGDPDRSSKVGVAGEAPDLTRALELAGIDVEFVQEVPLDASELAPFDAVISIPDDYEADRQRWRPVAVQLFVGRGADSRRAERRVTSVIRAYRARIGSTELIRRGIAPAVTRPVGWMTVDLSESSRTDLFATLLLMYVVLAPFLAGTGAAIDSATGERERGTLSLMRLQPLSPWAWVTGKWLVIATFSWAGTVVTAIVSVLALAQFAPSIATSLALSPTSVATLCLATLPIALVASALTFGLALQARSTMEAQTRLTLLSVVPVGIGLLATTGGAPQGWALPVLHEVTGLSSWLSGGAFPAEQALFNLLICAALVSVTLSWGARRIVSEAYGVGV